MLSPAESDGAVVPTWLMRLREGLTWTLWVGSGRNCGWRPEPGAHVHTPGVYGPLPSWLPGGGLEEEVLQYVSQVFPGAMPWHQGRQARSGVTQSQLLSRFYQARLSGLREGPSLTGP